MRYLLCMVNNLFLPQIDYFMSVGGDTLSGAASGAALGSSILPGWGTAIGAVVGAGAGLISGESKKKKRDAAAKAVQRPTYQIPQEIFQNQAMYEAQANSSRVPGQENIEKQIGQLQSQSLNASQKAAGSSADALAAVGQTQQNTLDQYGNLAQMGAQYQLQNKDKLAQARETTADYQQQAFDYNKNEPYQQAYAYNQKLQDQNRQDNQNMVNDVQALSALGTSAIGSSYDKYGRKKTSSSPAISPNPSNGGPYQYGTGGYNSFSF